jgi:hypothetical protein
MLLSTNPTIYGLKEKHNRKKIEPREIKYTNPTHLFRKIIIIKKNTQIPLRSYNPVNQSNFSNPLPKVAQGNFPQS